MAEKMKILVVGCGSIGKRHLKVLTERPQVEIAACELRREVFPQIEEISPEIAIFNNLELALAWQPQIAIVAVPNQFHHTVGIQCLRAGVHVLCEKPLADTVEHATQLVETAKEKKRVLAVVFSERYRPSILYLENLAGSGQMGNLLAGRAMVGTYNTLLCATTDSRSEQVGSLLLDYTHEFDFLRAIFGNVEDIYCVGHNLGRRKLLQVNPTVAVVVLRYTGGAIVSVHLDYIQHPQRRLLEVIGEELTVALDLQTDVMKIYDWKQDGYRVLTFDPVRNERIKAEHQDMIKAVLKGTKPRVTGEEALEVQKVAEEAIRQLTIH
ncbi:MAG: Gfo/Idh/MocA family oxidoreductase [Candidatus Omnitrophica bacterium]|nr:Gfo/Idh/MocA family oxidoreductase [Candidatus Omnitrophota bacterium]